MGVAGTIIGSVISSVLYNMLTEALEKPVGQATFSTDFEWEIAYIFPLVVIVLIQLLLILALFAEIGLLPYTFLNVYLSIQRFAEKHLEKIGGFESVTIGDLSGLDISKLVDMLNYSGINNTMNANSIPQSPNIGGFDLGTIMKFQNVLSGFNQSDPRQNLLSSLKPFLRETRQKNIDTYITLLGVMKAFNIFTSKDRD